MKPILLTLKGFRGILDGLGRDELTLDFEALSGNAQLIAIVGKNGRGKTTVMDNMTPYPVMPSRAGADGLGSFSYYEHVFLSESVKDLVWEHDGERYRSQIVIRRNGKKRTEAYLHASKAGGWVPVTLPDGTVSDGKLDTYLRCVEAILGSAQTFFTSVFAAQGRRQLSAYRNAEIKTLLADLLGLEEIRALGAKACETAKLLKAGLATVRQERMVLQTEAGQIASAIARLGNTPQRIAAAQAAKTACQGAVDAAKDALAKLRANQEVATHAEVRRAQLQAERRAIIEDGKAALAAMDHQDQREADRIASLEKRVAQRAAEQQRKRSALIQQRHGYVEVIQDGRRIERAVRRLPWAQHIASAREAGMLPLSRAVERWNALLASETLVREKLVAIERAAGQAALNAQELARRFGLTAAVPCVGTDLQRQCKLLGDARDAKSLMPSTDRQLRQLEEERRQLAQRLAEIREQAAQLAGMPAQLARAEEKLQRARAAASALAMRGARCGELQQARAALAVIEAQIAALPAVGEGDTEEEQAERAAVAAAVQQIAVLRAAQSQRYRDALDRVEMALAGLPAPFDVSQVAHARQALARAQRAMADAEAAFMATVRDQQRMEEFLGRQDAVAHKLAQLDARCTDIEQELGPWMLFVRCMRNDGLIALSIDDAGPTLSRLANDLLLACYGPRFTVAIKTQVETGKGEAREGFDIVVHDADAGGSKSVTAMSGGERVMINECLTRAIALYLAQNSGRRYATLFSDEADGALDPDRKRMFIAIKRAVLRIGRYACEYFVSQTPELTAMADAVIDLGQYGAREIGVECAA
jgi:exonuclease SbcC